jgi:glycosyltransferase involved in cell wall biosynthesis
MNIPGTKGRGKVLRIVAPRGYPWRFNGPRQSAHDIAIRNYVPFNKLKSNLDGMTLFNPLDTIRADLIHGFNRIPLNRTPFVLGFESHMPRVFGLEKSGYERFLYSNLVSARCRRIVAISHYAARNFRDGIAEAQISSEEAEILLGKLEVRHPNLPVAPEAGRELDFKDGVVITFVGNHFARKGGCSVARMAQISQERGLPIRFNIVSSLQCGGPIWTDPSRDSFFDPYRSLLSLPNIQLLSNLTNAQVGELLGQSHFSILTTFGDTFGFSVLESMAVGTPAVVTRQGALPEVVDDGINGIVLDPALTPGERGWRWPFDKRDTPEFEKLFADNVERLAVETMDRITALIERPADYAAMRRAAHEKAESSFDSVAAQDYWDQLYRVCLDRRGRTWPDAVPPPPLPLQA